MNSETRPTSDLSGDPYFDRSRAPLPSLIFLLPLLLAYELGAMRYAGAMDGQGLRVVTWIQQFLETFGAVGFYLPGLAVIVVLLVWHGASRQPWRVGPPVIYPWMGAESLVLALPVLVLALMVFGRPVAFGDRWAVEAVYSIGAGVYEELVFRLIGIALIHGLAVDLMGLSHRAGAAAAVGLTSLAFAAAHYSEGSTMTWGAFLASPRFVFCVISGAYFAAVYVMRGFGLVAASHAFYDLMVTGIAHGWRPDAS